MCRISNHPLPDMVGGDCYWKEHIVGPRYRQVIADITAQIEDGILKPGDQLPSTIELCNQYEVSPTVINQAVLILGAQGLIEGAPGIGRFVTRE